MLGVCNDCLREASLLRASERGKRTRGKHVPFLIEREVVTSRCHGSQISGPQQTEVLQSGGSQTHGSRYRTLVLFCPFVSRLPPFIVFLLLSCKSRCLTPYSNMECFGLSKMKIAVVNRTTSHSPARSLKRHSFDTTLHHAAKSSVFCELELYGASSQEGLPWKDFSPPHRRIRDR